MDRLVQLAGFYREGRPVYDKLNSIKWKKKREEYAAEQEHTLHFFYMARRELKPYLAEGKLPIKEWKAELTRLKTDCEKIGKQQKVIHAELKSIRQIRYAVDSILHEQENTVTRQKKREIEH